MHCTECIELYRLSGFCALPVTYTSTIDGRTKKPSCKQNLIPTMTGST